MSLRLKTIIGIAFIEAVLFAVLITNVLNYMRDSSHSNFINYSNNISQLFATTTKDAVLSYDLASLESFTSSILENKDIVYVRIKDANANVLVEDGDTVILKNAFSADKNIKHIDDEIYDISIPIVEADTVYSNIEIGISTASIRKSIQNARTLSGTIAFAEMILVAIFSLILGTYLTHQLKDLSIAANEISKSNYQYKIKVNGKDELALLARSFNKMADALAVADKSRKEFESAIKELNAQLELRIKKRTAELLNKNKELTNAYDKLKKTQNQLLQSEKMASVGQLAAGVAHEINNPIGFVSSNFNSLESYINNYKMLTQNCLKLFDVMKPYAKDNHRHYIEKIQKQVKDDNFEFISEDIEELLCDSIEGTQRITEIVKNLKEYSHTDQEAIRESDINACIETTLKMVNNNLKYKCKINKDLQALPLIKCNPGKLNQVFTNLIINAGQAITDHGTIDIKTTAANDRILILISDNGKGIPEENINKLFDPFFTTKAVGEGTGLGLSISYGIIKEHGGTITVDSILYKGTTFTISLPIHQQSDNSEA